MNKKRNKAYDRVMSRVHNNSVSSLNANSIVTRHEMPSSVRVGAKASSSNFGSSVFSELPTVLNDYVPENSVVRDESSARRSRVVKPRRTLKSLDTSKSPPRTVSKSRAATHLLKARASSPTLTRDEKWSDRHARQCYSSRSHSKLKELKDEIRAFHETEKLMRLRSHLYKKCGVVFDDDGYVASDKAVQADVEEKRPEELRSEQRAGSGEDARAAVPDQQMRSGTPRYPVDRYMVESSNTVEMVNILGDELWAPEPALRPEDELLLRRLHDMLTTTADDLKLLSGELAKYHEPGVQIKTQPTPLDEEFNEKVHIQELVNAKFHGHKIIDKPIGPKVVASSKPNVNTGVQVDSVTVKKPVKRRNLEITRTRILEIDEKIDKGTKHKLNNGKIVNNAPTVAYNEFTYQHVEPKVENSLQNKLKVQDMPSINIRSELKEQKVLQLDIFPENREKAQNSVNKNVAVIAFEHKNAVPEQENPEITLTNKEKLLLQPQVQEPRRSLSQTNIKKQPIRKVSKMSTCESSESTNNVSSDTQHNLKTQKQIKSVIRLSPKASARDRAKIKKTNNKESEKRTHFNLDDWKKKLNVVYGQQSSSRNIKSKPVKKPLKISNISASTSRPAVNQLNNAEYIPYSHLTLGGVRVSDVEREIEDIPNKNDIPLSPILDKILSSRENSFHKESPNKRKKESPRIFTTSDENLLQEVIDIEKAVSKTIENNNKKKVDRKEEKIQSISSESKDEDDNKDSYADDFEDENTENTDKPTKKDKDDSSSEEHRNNKSDSDDDDDSDNDNDDNNPNPTKSRIHNRTYTKTPNLSIKNQVDVFEFVHSVDTQDTATQSNTTHKISLKETQTSPRNEKPNINPIHNDLWPADPKGEIENMFKLEKDFIKKLILEEYGDIFEKNINKPSTSKDVTVVEEQHSNVVASQKNTQTSPARAKSVMTSPTRTKTRTTSPFLSVTVDHQTSPMIVVTNDEHLTVEVNNEDDSISINLSSPRFSLRLPQTSREVLSNLEVASLAPSKVEQKENVVKAKTFRKGSITSSSSEVENSSEMSSLGEVKSKLKRRLRKRVPTISESSETSSTSKYSSDMLSTGIIPLRSEGEVSLGQRVRKVSNKTSKSEGETSVGRSK